MRSSPWSRAWLSSLCVAGVVGGVFACSGSGGDRSPFDPEEPPSDNDDDDAQASTSSGGGNSNGSIPTTDAGHTPPNDGSFEECASSEAEGELLPLYLVLALDTSGSMCWTQASTSSNCSASNNLWTAVKTALGAFFAAPESANTFVSIVPWSGHDTAACSNNFPVLANAAEIELPAGATALNERLASLSPIGGTPTANGIRSAVIYAQGLTLPNNLKANVVLVTDGKPEGCQDSEAAAATAAYDQTLAARNAGYPPFVIGIENWWAPNSLGVLGGIAGIAETNGGQPFLIQQQTPADIATGLLTALNTIRQQTIGCDLAIPAPPEGETLDFERVNVVHVSPEGQQSDFVYSADCSAPNSWRYDADPPSRIELCESTCNSTRTTGGTLKVVLGCETRSGGIH